MDCDVPLRVALIIGSTREGRAGAGIGAWFASQARRRGDVDLNTVDLADYAFPSRYPDVPTPSMVAFTSKVDAADAFVIVTPEYNRSFPASLKQAVDYAYDEWRAKPVAFVSYGCRSEGLYAVEQLRGVFTELHTVTMRNGVGLNLLHGDGHPLDGEAPEQAATTMLDQLVWWGLALREARAARPYIS